MVPSNPPLIILPTRYNYPKARKRPILHKILLYSDTVSASHFVVLGLTRIVMWDTYLQSLQ